MNTQSSRGGATVDELDDDPRAQPWRRITTSKLFERTIAFFIVTAALLVGVETYPGMRRSYGTALAVFDLVVLTIFVAEIVMRMLAEGSKPWRFFGDRWNTFDFVLVVSALLPMTAGFVGVVRIVRLMRIIRLVRTMPKLRLLIATTLNSIPSIVWISVLLGVLFYVYAVAGVFFFADNDPIHFRDLQTSMVSLFRVITLEDWTDIMYIQIYGCADYGYGDNAELCSDSRAFGAFGALFFITFVFIGTWIVLNLFIGVVLDGMDQARRELDDGPTNAAPVAPPPDSPEPTDMGDELALLEEQLTMIQERVERLRTFQH